MQYMQNWVRWPDVGSPVLRLSCSAAEDAVRETCREALQEQAVADWQHACQGVQPWHAQEIIAARALHAFACQSSWC